MASPVTLRASLIALGIALPLAGFAVAQTTPPASSPAAAPAMTGSSKVVARANGIDITEADLALASEDPALQVPGVTDAQKRDLLIGYMVDLKLGARAAEAAKVGDSEEVKRRLAYARDKALVEEYLDREVKKSVTAEAAKKLYDDTVKGISPEAEVRARHILVENEDEAKAVEKRLKGGEDFAKVAAEASKDPGSKDEGGDLGFFTKDRMVEPFAEAAFKLEAGQLSEPVKTQFGWHVIKVEEKRTKPIPAFEEMKEQVEAYLGRKAQQDAILAIRATAKVERIDENGNLVEQKKP